MNQPSNRQTENRLRRIDAVAAGKRDPRSRTGISSASQHLSGDCSVELVHRPAQDSYGQNRLSAHRVDVADCIHGSYRTEVKWIVHDRHEKVRRADDRLIVVDLVYGSIIASLIADEQTRVMNLGWNFLQDFGKNGRRDLTAATRSV